MTDLKRLQSALTYEFKDIGLLRLALSHRSVGSRNNERLEFLGDSIVNHVVAEALYAKFPDAREGDLSRMRAALVKGETLAEMARELDLGSALELGPGERKSGGYRRASILADTFEAVTGAILLDSGTEACRRFLLHHFNSRLSGAGEQLTRKDAKTALQEYLQGRHLPLPEYRLLSTSGADHDQIFEVACCLASPPQEWIAKGHSRRKTEQAAAALALESLTDGN